VKQKNCVIELRPVARLLITPNGRQKKETINMQITVFADKEFPNDWHVEAIDTKSGDIFQAVFAGPDAEDRAREYADWQRSKQIPQ
jgi:hypothetical protein